MGKGTRLDYFFAIVFFLIILMIIRLFDIQVLSHTYLYRRALSQWQGSSREEIRGGVFDRDGRSLLDSQKVNYALISPRWLKESEIEYLKKNNILSFEDPYKPQSVRLSPENIAVIKKLLGRTPGVFVYQKEKRYGQNALATHVVGYKGKAGIEKTFDKFLNGGRIKTGIIYDGFGQPIPGASKENLFTEKWGVWLTIDREIQAAVEEVMDTEIQRGAVVVLDAKTGEILAMASRPNYKQSDLDAYLNQKDAPLINRAVEAYIPGSIFKIVVLAAALEEKVTDLDEEFHCSGAIRVGGNVIKCYSHEKGGHGRLTLKDALAYSCNSVFIELGMRLGKERVLEYAEKFGLGERVLSDLSEEKTGFIPASRDVYREDLGNLSIGQGKLQVTPLQAAQMLLIIANDGIKIKPYLVKKVVDSTGSTVTADTPATRFSERVISKDTARKVKEALRAVTQYGTGMLAAPSKVHVEVAGKTGTAELGDGNNHAWFVGYYPAEDPRYIVTVFVEKGQSGPFKAAPIFGKIVEKIYYLKGR